MHRKRKLPSFNTVAAGATSSVLIPRGPTYRALILNYQANAAAANEATLKADIDRIRIKINGVSRVDVSGKHAIDNLQKFYGIAHRDGQIVIPLSRPHLRTIEAEENLCWGTRNIDSLELAVDINGAAVSPVLTAEALITPESRDLGTIVEVHELIRATSTGGLFEVPNLPRGNGLMGALHFDSDKITAIEAKVNGVTFIDGDLDSYTDMLKYITQRVPQANYVHIDALLLNRIEDAWPMRNVEDFRINLTVSEAANVPIVMETINQPLGPARA